MYCGIYEYAGVYRGIEGWGGDVGKSYIERERAVRRALMMMMMVMTTTTVVMVVVVVVMMYQTGLPYITNTVILCNSLSYI